MSVDKPEMPEFSAQMSVLWAYTDPKDSNRMGGADAIPQMTFPGFQSGYGSELRHLVIQATPSVGSNRLVCSVSDQYRYLYEWVEGPAAPAPVSATPSTAPPPDKPAGHLRLIFNTNQGGPVSGASIAVRELSSGQLKRLTTNSKGEAKAMFRGEEAGEPVAVEVEEVVLNAQTRYGLALGSRASGYRSSKEVMRDFLAVQAHCQSNQGHPPRTTQEFFQSQQQWLQARQTQGPLTGP